MVTNTPVNGKTTPNMALGVTSMQEEKVILENGVETGNMAKASKNLKTVTYWKVTIIMGLSTVKEKLFIIVVLYTEDTSLKTKSRDLGAIQL